MPSESKVEGSNSKKDIPVKFRASVLALQQRLAQFATYPDKSDLLIPKITGKNDLILSDAYVVGSELRTFELQNYDDKSVTPINEFLEHFGRKVGIQPIMMDNWERFDQLDSEGIISRYRNRVFRLKTSDGIDRLVFPTDIKDVSMAVCYVGKELGVDFVVFQDEDLQMKELQRELPPVFKSLEHYAKTMSPALIHTFCEHILDNPLVNLHYYSEDTGKQLSPLELIIDTMQRHYSYFTEPMSYTKMETASRLVKGVIGGLSNDAQIQVSAESLFTKVGAGVSMVSGTEPQKTRGEISKWGLTELDLAGQIMDSLMLATYAFNLKKKIETEFGLNDPAHKS